MTLSECGVLAAAAESPLELERLDRLRRLKRDLQSLTPLEPEHENLDRIRARLAAPRRQPSGRVLLAGAAVVMLGALAAVMVRNEGAPAPASEEIGGTHEMQPGQSTARQIGSGPPNALCGRVGSSFSAR